MKNLVTGGSGYFGDVLVRKLRRRGKNVSILDLMENADRPSDVEFIKGDICCYETVEQACRGVDVVYHCVAQVPLARNKDLFQAVNVGGCKNLLEACQQSGVRKVVLLSSSAVFGVPKQNPVDEALQPEPGEAYGRTKLVAEEMAADFSRQHGLDVTIIRPRTILGHGRLGIFQVLFDWVESGKAVYVLGCGDNLYQFVHADDLAEACILAADRPGFRVYNIGADNFSTMRETLEGLVAHAKTTSRVRSLPMAPTVVAMRMLAAMRLVPLAPYHWLMYGREMYFDLSRAKAELSWNPERGNVDMICESYDWYLQNKQHLDHSNASAHRSMVKQGILKILKWVS